MNLLGAKIVSLVLMVTFKFSSGLLPMVLLPRVRKLGVSKRAIEKFMGGVLCIGGGFFLATVFVHMIPEVRETFETAFDLQKKEEGTDAADSDLEEFPMAEVVVCSGFFLVSIIEAVVHKIIARKKGGQSHGHGHGIPSQFMEGGADDPENRAVKSPDNSSFDSGVDSPSFNNENETVSGNKKNDDATKSAVSYKASTSEVTGFNSEKLPTEAEAAESDLKQRKLLFSIRNFLVVLALSIHSLFEGMALGVQLTPNDVWMLLVAISIHDVAIHFCIGMEMVNGGIRKLHIFGYIAMMSLVLPIGVLVGILATSDVEDGSGSSTQTFVIATLQGLSGGTLLYITFIEILSREKLEKTGMTGILGCFLLVVGFGAMTALSAAGGHSHGVTEVAETAASGGHGHAHTDVLKRLANVELEDDFFKTLKESFDKYQEKIEGPAPPNQDENLDENLDDSGNNATEDPDHDHEAAGDHHEDVE